MSALPQVNELGCFEIRFESLGGLGANLAGSLLAEASLYKMGFNASNFSSYGSEKKGSVVKAFVRLSEANRPIRDGSPILQPHLLAVFHESLLSLPDVLAGVNPQGTVIVNTASEKIPESCQGVAERIVLIDALGIALAEKTRVNTAMLGAVARTCEFLDAKAIAETIKEEFAGKSAKLGEMNEKTFWRGHGEVKVFEGQPSAKTAVPFRAFPKFGYLTQPIGGAIFQPGNTVENNLSVSRQGFAPKLDKNKCIHCGVCDLVCPDYCFVWQAEKDVKGEIKKVRLEGIDYRYCKGCLRCVESCPSGALSKETEGSWVEAARVPLRHGAAPAQVPDVNKKVGLRG